MKKKKILVFVDWYLPGFRAGGPIRSVANMITHLKNDFDFSIITSDTDYCETIPYLNIKSNEWNNLSDPHEVTDSGFQRKGTRVFYFSKNEISFRKIKKIIETESFDVIYLNSFFSYYFTIIPIIIFFFNSKLQTPNSKLILAPRGMLADTALAIKRVKKQFYLFLFKITGISKKIIFHASSESEEYDIRRELGRKVKIFLALNLSKNLSKKRSETQLTQKQKKSGELKLINFARISQEKNLFFALEILKVVKSTIVFDFYGTVYDKNYWEECKTLIKSLPSNITVNYKGVIENSLIDNAFKDYHFMFMPTQGENFGHIISESLSNGVPVIISNKTPWRNLETNNAGWDIPLNSKQKFIEVIERCAAMNQQEYNEWSINAFNFSTEFQNNEESMEQNRKMFLAN